MEIGISQEDQREAVFQKKLSFGRISESRIFRWLRGKGFTLIPVCDIDSDAKSGPRIFTPSESLVSPDFIMFANKKFLFLEAKGRHVFSWRRNTQKWECGIDRLYYRDYKKVREHFDLPLWILFLMHQSKPTPKDKLWGCPDVAPTGLYGGLIDDLDKIISHEDDRYGTGGMVYWEEEKLRKIEEAEAVR